jgi:hypothetical protein
VAPTRAKTGLRVPPCASSVSFASWQSPYRCVGTCASLRTDSDGHCRCRSLFESTPSAARPKEQAQRRTRSPQEAPHQPGPRKLQACVPCATDPRWFKREPTSNATIGSRIARLRDRAISRAVLSPHSPRRAHERSRAKCSAKNNAAGARIRGTPSTSDQSLFPGSAPQGGDAQSGIKTPAPARRAPATLKKWLYRANWGRSFADPASQVARVTAPAALNDAVSHLRRSLRCPFRDIPMMRLCHNRVRLAWLATQSSVHPIRETGRALRRRPGSARRVSACSRGFVPLRAIVAT